MSLFKARDWWSTSCGAEEEFDKGCLCVANIDNSSEGSDKIIVGSHSGVLRIFNPHPVKKEDGTYSNFRPDELLLEGQLNYPIIQIASGHLVSSSSLLHLVILHPFKLSVYLISTIQGAVDHGTHYHLSLAYEHNLQRTACNLVIGPFGGTQGKDLMCVQSLDGTLTFFEQESFAFSRFLPNFLLPGPLVYIAKTDSFVTVSGFSAESYRFQVLAVAKDCDSEEELENFKGKRVTLDWSYNLGEAVLDIAVVERQQQSATILILGEKTLFVLHSNGVLKYTKKLDYNPSCFLSYKDGTNGCLTVLIVTFTQTLLVYQDTQLKWAAQLPFCPVCIQRASFVELNGILVILSGEGNVSCCYLGTDPSLFVSPVAEAREIDFEEAEQEMLRLRKLIKSSNNAFPGAQRLGSEIIISIIIPQNLDPLTGDGSTTGNVIFHENFGPVPSMTVKLQLKCTTTVHDVRLMIHVEPPLRVSQSVFTFGSLLDYSQAVVTVFMESPYLPSSLKLIALAAYTNSHGGPRIAESSSLLPLHLVTKPCLPTKNANYRITIDINKKTLPIGDLFSDFVGDSATITGGALGFEYYCNQQVTVLPSKTSQRYRIQSDSFSALWLVVSELVKRLYRRYKKDETNSDFKCSYSSSLPLQDYFSIIDEHFECRQARNQVEDLLSHRAEQFRAVQKRLLTKLKDKTPTPLNNLDTLLEATHRHIMSIAETLERNIEAVEASSCSLSCATRLMLFLLQLSTGLKEKEISFIEACFSPHVDFETKQGWEERIDISLTFLLKSCLGKTGNDANIADSLLNMPKDLAKLKKHLTLAFDKIIKNDYHMINATSENDEVKDNPKDSESHQGEDTIIPVGSKFGERKSARGERKLQLSENQNKMLFESLSNS